VELYRLLNVTVTQLKTCSFAVNIAVELKNMTATSDITGTIDRLNITTKGR